ncbi:HAMP domain-containing sensor histidine kinase [Desulfobacula sp.]|uniref:sensor histidine kinase n=1 Tax=Desulfobacula sp. TaxID=2593537 RepID=UPI0025BCA26A|nr:HAMP domain-containing sensor histidine kinase [Desulfobacula sp.]MBC2704961.1 HAMP domain-containing histidine kinase [Desulfobacula sp.]
MKTTKNPLKQKLFIIEALVFLIPVLAGIYIYFEKGISFENNHILIILASLCLILGGMLLLRQVFDRILMIQNIMKTAECGEQYVIDAQKDTGDLHEITNSFNNLMNNFQESNKELQRSIEEIAERKKVAAALQRAKEEAEAANMAKSRFLANMSHEFLSPLNDVIGFSQLLKANTHGELNEKQMEYTNNVLESGQHLVRLTTEILELSKIETRRIELKLSEFDATDELQDAANLVTASADKKEIALTLDVQPDMPPITADQDSFQHIVLNLLNNALKFTSAGGSIALAAKIIKGSELQIPGLGKLKNFLQISVSDTGIGVKPEDQERIFSIFEQVDTSSKRRFNGSGLGLAMSRKLVELHKGKIWIESDGDDKGSRFSFVLPLKSDKR